MGALKQLILCSQVKKSSNLTLGSATYPFEGPGGQPKLEKLYILMMDFEHSIRNLFSCATNKCNMCELVFRNIFNEQLRRNYLAHFHKTYSCVIVLLERRLFNVISLSTEA